MAQTTPTWMLLTGGVLAGGGVIYLLHPPTRHATTTARNTTVRQTVRKTIRQTAFHTVTHTTTPKTTPKTYTASIQVNGSQFRTHESVPIAVTLNHTLGQGMTLQLINLSSSQVVATQTSGTSLTYKATASTNTTRQYRARLVRNGRVQTQSSTVTVTWKDTANGTNSGYANAAGNTVHLTVSPNGTEATLTAQASGISNPLYQFWWAGPGTAYKSNGGYQTTNQITIKTPLNGTWYVTVYARSASAPHGETNTQRAKYEAKSNTHTITVTTGVNPTHHTARASGSLSLSSSLSTATEGQVADLTAQASGISSPVYQFWWQTPAGHWQSSGFYSAKNPYHLGLNATGTWHVMVFARPASAPSNETAAQRAKYEVKSSTHTISVH